MDKALSNRIDLSERDLSIAALTIYGEARGEPYAGKVAVAWVIRNRTEADIHGGIAVSMLGKAVAAAGYELGPEDQQVLIAGIPFLISFAGDAYAMYGRTRATKQVSVTGK